MVRFVRYLFSGNPRYRVGSLFYSTCYGGSAGELNLDVGRLGRRKGAWLHRVDRLAWTLGVARSGEEWQGVARSGKECQIYLGSYRGPPRSHRECQGRNTLPSRGSTSKSLSGSVGATTATRLMKQRTRRRQDDATGTTVPKRRSSNARVVGPLSI